MALTGNTLYYILLSTAVQTGGIAMTSLVIGFLPVAVMVGISYALWAGLCAAFIAYEPQGEAPDRMNRVVRRTI